MCTVIVRPSSFVVHWYYHIDSKSIFMITAISSHMSPLYCREKSKQMLAYVTMSSPIRRDRLMKYISHIVGTTLNSMTVPVPVYADIDECSGNQYCPADNATCVNTNGSFNCTCNDGFIPYNSNGMVTCLGEYYPLSNECGLQKTNYASWRVQTI
jgi:hypothetical protein